MEPINKSWKHYTIPNGGESIDIFYKWNIKRYKLWIFYYTVHWSMYNKVFIIYNILYGTCLFLTSSFDKIVSVGLGLGG